MRFHLVLPTTTALSLPFKDATINSDSIINLSTSDDDDGKNLGDLDWARVQAQADGKAAVVTLHTRDKDWIKGPLQISITDNAGTCLQGTYQPEDAPAYVSWITPLQAASDVADGAQPWIIHLNVADGKTDSVSISSVTFNGVKVSTSPSTLTVSGDAPRAVATFVAPTTLSRGDVFVVEVGLSSGHTIANTAKTPETRFPIMAWAHSTDCPVHGSNEDNYKLNTQNYIDSVYEQWGSYKDNCGSDLDTAINANAINPAVANSSYFFVDTKAVKDGKFTAAGAGHISAVMIADEDDGKYNHDFRDTLADSLQVEAAKGGLLSFQGGKTNLHDGAYAGIGDIQGVDLYIGACAPVIIPVLFGIRADAPFMYGKNARNNQMPLSTMVYSQMYSDAWTYQPEGHEIAMQLGMAVATGSKGLLLFQSNAELIKKAGKDWTGLLHHVLGNIAGVRDTLWQGDVDGFKFKVSNSEGTSIVSVIRSHSSLVVLVLNMNASGYSDTLCHVFAKAHWNLGHTTVGSVDISISPDATLTQAGVSAAHEFVDGSPDSLQNGASLKLSGNVLSLSNVVLGIAASDLFRVFKVPLK